MIHLPSGGHYQRMSKDRDSDPPDVPLLLRAHSEQRWLSREVIPVVRQIETGEGLPEEQLPAAIAYLEVIWAEAEGLAREADAALRHLDALDLAPRPLLTRARRYHISVRALREAVALRVAALTERGMRAGGECLPASASTPADALLDELAVDDQPSAAARR